MTAFLPQHDPESSARSSELADARRKYQFNYQYVCPLALVDNPPFPDEFSFKWSLAVANHSRDALLNVIELEDDSQFRSTYLEGVRHLTQALSKSQFDQKVFLKEILSVVVDIADDSRQDDMLSHAKLFRRIGLPPVCRYFNRDWMFVNQRLAGPNPLMLERMTQPDPRFPVTEQHFQVSMPGDSLEAAIAEGRLYKVDYHMLESLEPSSFPRRRKYVYAPIALFAIDKASRELKAVAIQCEQQPGPDNPIFTPQHGWNWRLAKMIVEIADGNVHQPIAHLGRTHLLIEPFAVVTQRQLSARHPLHALLRPHFEGTMNINYMAHQALIAPRNIVDRVLAGKLESTANLTVWGLKNYPVRDAMLPSMLRSRGVDDPELLPHYPYRDDAILYWNAIRDWVAQYLAIYYTNDTDLTEDQELQSWLSELIAVDGGRVIGLAENSAQVTLDYLCSVLTLVIFTASVQHAAVNFPQVDRLSYVPNMPLAGYSPRPQTVDGATEQDYVDMLPPRDQEIVQMTAGQILGTVHYNQLGQYERGHFADERVSEPLKSFQQRIAEIGRTIDQQNQGRHPYMYLTPAGVPQSINI